jgi:hypothetical protein
LDERLRIEEWEVLMMRVIVAVMVLVLGASTSVLASGGQPEIGQVAGRLRRSIERGAIRMARQSAGTVDPQASQRTWAERHPVALGMVIGMAGGVAVGAAQHYEGERPFGPYMALGGGIGVGIGTGVGAIISAMRR